MGDLDGCTTVAIGPYRQLSDSIAAVVALLVALKMSKGKEIHILALDGGGSKAIMEVMMLQDIMNVSTLLRDRPKDMLKLLNGFIDDVGQVWQDQEINMLLHSFMII